MDGEPMEVVHWHSEMGWQVAVVVSLGHKFMRVLCIDGKVKIKRLPMQEMKFMLPMKDTPRSSGAIRQVTYKTEKALREFRKAYKVLNIVPIYEEDAYGHKMVVGWKVPPMPKDLKRVLARGADLRGIRYPKAMKKVNRMMPRERDRLLADRGAL